MALGGRVRAGRDAVRRARARSACCALRGGRCGTASALHEGTRAARRVRVARDGARRRRRSSWRSATARDRGHDRAGVDAQDAAAGDRRRRRWRRRSRSTPGLLDESAGRHARRTSWRWSAGAGIAASGAAGRVEPRRGPARRLAERAHRVGRRRAARGRAAAVRRAARRRRLRFTRAGPARPARELPRHRAPTTSSRSERSPARCRSRAPLRDGWGVMERHERALVILAAIALVARDRGRDRAQDRAPEALVALGGAARAARDRRAVVERRARRGAGARRRRSSCSRRCWCSATAASGRACSTRSPRGWRRARAGRGRGCSRWWWPRPPR